MSMIKSDPLKVLKNALRNLSVEGMFSIKIPVMYDNNKNVHANKQRKPRSNQKLCVPIINYTNFCLLNILNQYSRNNH